VERNGNGTAMDTLAQRTPVKDVADIFWEVCKDMEIESFIDVGTGLTGVVGLHYWQKKGIKRKYALDIFKIRDLPSGWEPIIMDARRMAESFPPKSIDIVQACDFIEHLTKEDGLKWLQDCEAIARKAILIFTPIGFVDNKPGENLYPDNPHQKHLSGWTYEEFEKLGFKTAKDDPQNMWRKKAIIAWKIL